MFFSFFKYQGTGNDFIILDDRTSGWAKQLTQAHIARLCDRRFGIGADGLMLLQASEQADFGMRYYNADGAEGSMCGNGGRCLVAFAHRLDMVSGSCTFEAIDGLHEAEIQGGSVRLRMIAPYGYRNLGAHASWVHTGSPHYVEFLTKGLENLDVMERGRRIRYDEAFAAGGGTNANFVQVMAHGRLKVRTYERGVEAETLSCGTGVTACAYVYQREQAPALTAIQLETPGGLLTVSLPHETEGPAEPWLEGAATFVFEGRMEVP